MFNNKTLKGLAISAVVALGFAGISGGAASANYGLADKTFVTVAPSTGDEWSVLADGDFTVRASKASNLTGTLKLLVEDVSRNLTATSSITVSAVAGVMPSSYTSSTSDGLTRKSATDGTFVLASSASGAVTVDFPLSAIASKTISSASFTVKVTAWNDANLDGVIQSTEYASATETITFVDGDLVAIDVVLNRPIVGESALTALVSTTPTLNHEMGADLNANSASNFVMAFNRNGFATTQSAASIVWDEDDRNYTVTSAALSAAGWAINRSSNTTLSATVTASSTAKGTYVFTALNETFVSVGDGFSFQYASETAVRATVSKIVSSKSFEASVASTTATASAALITASAYASVYDAVTPGTYGARAYWLTVAGALSEYATAAVVSDDVQIDVAASAAVTGVSAGLGAAEAVTVKAGTTTVDIVATVLDEDGDAVGAGRVVQITATNLSTTLKVNGKTGTDTVLTDANGQVKATVTSTAGTSGTTTTVTFTAEGAAASGVALTWATQAFSLKDMSVANTDIAASRSIVAGASYTLDLMVADQWYQAPAAADTYRVVVTGTGAVNALVPVVAGKAAVTIGDSGVATAYSTVLTLQKLGTNGLYAAVAGGAVTIDTYVRTGAVTLGADTTLLYKVADGAVKLSSAVAAKALVEADLRVSNTAIPAYENNALIAGVVKNASTGVAVPGAVVTVTGPSNMLFNVGNVYKRGTITVVADTSGEFSAKVYSTTAQKDTVVTVTALGNSATTKLTFTGIGVGEGTSLVITAPDTVEPASTVQVKAKLTDAFGNPVTAAAGSMKVTYTGPGIIFGALPTSTDTAGELMFSALLGAADKGTITVVVSYDQNGDGDFVDAKDLNTTKVITVGAVEVVNAVIGSFKGRWAVRVENATGSTIAVKVGGNWYKYVALNDNYLFSRKSRVGASVRVSVYVNGSLENTETITVK